MIVVHVTKKEKFQTVRFDYKPEQQVREKLRALGGKWNGVDWSFRITQEEFLASVLPIIEEAAQKSNEELRVVTDEDREELLRLTANRLRLQPIPSGEHGNKGEM